MFVALVAASPAPKADPEAKPGVVVSAPLVSAPLVASSAVVERSFHGNLAYPYVAGYSAPLVAAPAYSPYAYSAYSPYAAAYTAPIIY